jgi:hypothetical protein
MNEVVKKTRKIQITLSENESEESLQEKLRLVIQRIDRKLEKLGSSFDSKYKTPGGFKYNELDGSAINIHNVTDLVYLIKSLAKMKRIKQEYEKTCSDEGISEYPVCKWHGSNVDDLINDLQIRILQVLNQSKILALTQQRTNLYEHLSKKDKLRESLTNALSLMK